MAAVGAAGGCWAAGGFLAAGEITGLMRSDATIVGELLISSESSGGIGVTLLFGSGTSDAGLGIRISTNGVC